MAQATGSTYGADPANSELDEVRLLIGDTDCATACLLDSEILFLIAEAGSPAFGAVLAAEACAAKAARLYDVSTGAVRKALSQKFDHFKQLVKDLKARAEESGSGPAPVFTAMTHTQKDADRADADMVQPNMRIKQDDNPRVVTADEELTGLIP